ncbi:unnamed protein product [Gongylonema pulchrum]|uniref:PDZ domain-containing protein n=1 Tax=Gongylonema pulchrum TaxID=637853 RepID=A0A183DR30_9BILA|nr:unnamed protein product [Gongylonema pulchrum]
MQLRTVICKFSFLTLSLLLLFHWYAPPRRRYFTVASELVLSTQLYISYGPVTTPAASVHSSQHLEATSSVDESVESSEGYTVEISLEKDPNSGLGLTLVDGNLNGVKGVYVRSVSEGGAGKRGGVNVGDRILSVNDVSLVGRDRHATVDLVKQGGDVVRLKIFRLVYSRIHALDAITSVFDSSSNKDKPNSIAQKENKVHLLPGSEVSRSRTPPAPRKLSGLPKKRARAVSDFGTVGDAFPDLNSEDLLANIRSESRLGYSRLEKLSSEGEEGSVRDNIPVASMYNFEGVDDEMAEQAPSEAVDSRTHLALKTNENDWSKASTKVVQQKRNYEDPNLDWADDLVDVVEPVRSGLSVVTLARNEGGSLGFQIASSGGNVYVKQITADPALSCSDIRVGDKLVQVNGERTENLTHQQVVDLLRKGGDTVSIGLQRSEKELIITPGNEIEQKVRVVLEKSQAGSLGLSLAKKTGYDGIYIRMISSGSAADIDGTLRIGDKIQKVNGQAVNNCTPGAIVDMLKAASSPVEIIVTRTGTK